MTEPLAVGQFAIVDHEPVDRAPCVGVFRGRGPADDRPELYVLAEGTTPAGEQFAAHVISAAGQAWASVDLSVTGSLMRLFAEAEKNLAEWNAHSIAQHRVSLGLGAVVRRGRQVVLAQAGPSLAFHLKAGSVRIYAPEGDHGRPLGANRDPAVPQLRGLMVDPGDRILLISTGAIDLADPELISAILALPPDQVLRDLYQRVREARSVSVLLLTMPAEPDRSQRALSPGPEDQAAAEESEEYIIGLDTPAPPLPPEPYQPSLFIAPGRPGAGAHGGEPLRGRSTIPQGLPVTETVALEPLRRVVGANSLPRLIGGSTPSRNRAQLGAGEAALPHAAASYGSGTATRRPRDRESFSRGLVRREEPPARPDPAAEPAPPVDLLARQRRSQAAGPRVADDALAVEAGESVASATPLVRVRQGVDGRWRASGSLSSSRAGTTGWRPPPVAVAIGLLLVALVLAVFVIPSQFRESPGERYARLVADAGVAVADARDGLDPSQRREALTRARAMLLEAREIRDEAEVTRLLQDVAAAMSQLDAIRSLAAVETVASLEQFGDRPLAVSRLAVGPEDVYLLDPAAGKVVGVSINGADRRVVFAEDATLLRGRPLAIATLEPPDSPVLALVVDSRNTLWALEGAAATRRAFTPPAAMAVTDIATQGDRLYVLDAAAHAVYQFTYADGGFAGAPERVLSSPALATARYLMVGDSIVTVDASGAVRRFDGTMALDLSQAGIDQPLSTAEPPQATAIPGEIAVLDPAHDRVVVLGADGTFLRQYRHEAFARITALVVSGQGSYVFSGGQLRRVTWE